MQLIAHIDDSFRMAREQFVSRAAGIDSVLGVAAFYLDRSAAHDVAARALHVLVTESLVSGEPLAQALHQFNQNSLAYLEAQIRVGVEQKQIRPDVDPAAEAVVILGALRGISAQFLTGETGANSARVRDGLLRTLEQGLRPAG